MEENRERAYEWNDTIQNDSSFTLLPPGDYDFEVRSFERARHTPGQGSRLPPCNKAVLTIELSSGSERAQVKHNLFLHSRCEGMLCEFFTAIGQRRHGEPLQMNWNVVTGARGRCKVGVREYTGSDGTLRKANEIRRFYEPSARPAYQAGKF